ncbi:MAG: RING finger protein [Oscillospiraceae bacterium]|nr:RING finger protein [Oscillospiraceae bacterium]
MSNLYEGKTCQICHSYLFDDDDVVVCPTCGAPQHRDCYNSLGHCGAESYHGTERQYDKVANQTVDTSNISPENSKEDNTICSRCGRLVIKGTFFCPYCGNSLNGPNGNQPGNQPLGNTGQFSGFPFGAGFAPMPVDPLGGVSPDATTDDVKASDIKEFVAVNTQRYIPKFFTLSKEKKTSWNWAAFLFPHGWLFYRKDFKPAILVSILMLAISITSLPLNIAISSIAGTLPLGYTQLDMANALIANINTIGLFPILLTLVGAVVSLTVRIICGIYGDWWYKQFTIESIKSINSNSLQEDRAAAFSKKGRVSTLWLFIAVLAISWFPTIINMIII